MNTFLLFCRSKGFRKPNRIKMKKEDIIFHHHFKEYKTTIGIVNEEGGHNYTFFVFNKNTEPAESLIKTYNLTLHPDIEEELLHSVNWLNKQSSIILKPFNKLIANIEDAIKVKEEDEYDPKFDNFSQVISIEQHAEIELSLDDAINTHILEAQSKQYDETIDELDKTLDLDLDEKKIVDVEIDEENNTVILNTKSDEAIKEIVDNNPDKDILVENHKVVIKGINATFKFGKDRDIVDNYNKKFKLLVGVLGAVLLALILITGIKHELINFKEGYIYIIISLLGILTTAIVILFKTRLNILKVIGLTKRGSRKLRPKDIQSKINIKTMKHIHRIQALSRFGSGFLLISSVILIHIGLFSTLVDTDILSQSTFYHYIFENGLLYWLNDYKITIIIGFIGIVVAIIILLSEHVLSRTALTKYKLVKIKFYYKHTLPTPFWLLLSGLIIIPTIIMVLI